MKQGKLVLQDAKDNHSRGTIFHKTSVTEQTECEDMSLYSET